MNANHKTNLFFEKMSTLFGKMKTVLWPIHFYELKKFIPMILIFFFISFNYSILRNMKDALLIDAAQTPGAEIIPYIKFWGVTPIAILFIMCYSKLSNLLSKQVLFYTVVSAFVVFFAIFAVFLYPNHNILHPENFAISFLPKGFTEVLRLWCFSLFYIFSELWGSVALSLLFWQFANQITKINEAKRFYGLFGLGANFALIGSGKAISLFKELAHSRLLSAEQAMEYKLNYLSLLFVLSCIAIMFIYWWINKYVLTDARFYDPSLLKQKSKKLKMNLTESIKMLLKSKYLICIALLVLCYGISINLIEVTWKSYLKMQYTSSSEYLDFMGTYSNYLGWTTIIMMLLFSNNILRKFGWTVAAQITPVVMLLLGVAFLNLIIFGNFFQPFTEKYGFTALGFAVLFGAIQNIISKGAKYSLFDPTKEMLYIPLDQESKVKGKAAIDVVGARLGKAGGSIIQQIMFGFGAVSVVLPYIEIIFIVVMLIWIMSVTNLGRLFKNVETEQPAT